MPKIPKLCSAMKKGLENHDAIFPCFHFKKMKKPRSFFRQRQINRNQLSTNHVHHQKLISIVEIFAGNSRILCGSQRPEIGESAQILLLSVVWYKAACCRQSTHRSSTIVQVQVKNKGHKNVLTVLYKVKWHLFTSFQASCALWNPDSNQENPALKISQ